jgi:hypothetical protein
VRTRLYALFIGGPFDGDLADRDPGEPPATAGVSPEGFYRLMWVREAWSGGMRLSVTAHYLWRDWGDEHVIARRELETVAS